MGSTAHRISNSFKLLNHWMVPCILFGLLGCAAGVSPTSLGGSSANSSAAAPGEDIPASSNQYGPLEAGNIAPDTEVGNIFLSLSCEQSLCLQSPEFHPVGASVHEEAPQQCPYLVKAHVYAEQAANTVAQVIDRKSNQGMYVKIDSDGDFEFLVSISADPALEFYDTTLSPDSVIFDTWMACSANTCPKDGSVLMRIKIFNQSCDFLKPKDRTLKGQNRGSFNLDGRLAE